LPSSPGDWASELDDPSGNPARSWRFGRGADSQCVFCDIPEEKTAELLYASPQWDYYYCYRCREWFKRLFGDSKTFLPVRSRTEVRRLTWIYTTRMRSVYELEQMSRHVEGVRRFVAGRLTRA